MKKNILTMALCLAAVFFTANTMNAQPVTPKAAFVSTYSSLSDLQTNGDDDEAAAAAWFVNTYGGTFLPVAALENTDLTQFKAIWIAIDRVGIGDGLPTELTETSVLTAIKTYYQAGGNLLLTNHATRYLVNLERTTRFPGIKGDGAGITNTDDLGVNSIIGSSYDHSGDFLYTGMTPDIPDGTARKVYNLIGSGYKEDHNSMWDLNAFGYNGDDGTNIVQDFETENNATVLGTWQHVTDYCCAGIVRFNPTATYLGKSIAIGLAAYEWNQNTDNTPPAEPETPAAVNTYQNNIITLTENALNELTPNTSVISINTTRTNVSIDAEETIIVNPGVQFTVTSSLTNNGVITLQSDAANGTATLLTPATITGSGTANVEQYLSTDNSREWYYLASPVTGAASTVFGTNQVSYYDETTALYRTVTGALAAGSGYVVKLTDGAFTNWVTFTGTLNNGDISIPVSRTGSTTAKRGYNLVGNPYPSYLDWDAVTKTGLQSTIWTRTYDAGEMVFRTYNADAQVGDDNQTTAHIAPLQAFWVKVEEVDSETDENVNLTFTNGERLHKAGGDANLRAAQADTRPIIRLQVSNGTNKDNAVILFDNRATDAFDSYDSEKMSKDNAAIPEIYSVQGTEKLVINTRNAVSAATEIALGFHTGTAGAFSISATKTDNFGSLPVLLRDKTADTDFDLTTGASYSFSSDITDTESRFAIVFAPQTTTGIDTNGYSPALSAYVNANREIVINTGKSFTLFNLLGRQVQNSHLPAGVYIVKAGKETIKAVVK